MEAEKDQKIQQKQKIKEIKKRIKQENKEPINYKLIVFAVLFSVFGGLIATNSEFFIENFIDDASFKQVIVILIVILIIMLIKFFKDYRKK